VGLGKHFYTMRSEGHRMTAKEEMFFKMRPFTEVKDSSKSKVSRKPKVSDTDTMSIIKDLLK